MRILLCMKWLVRLPEHSISFVRGLSRSVLTMFEKRATFFRFFASFIKSCCVKICILLLCAAIGYFAWAIFRPLDFGDKVWIINSGDTLGQVTSQLVQEGIIHDTFSFRLLAYLIRVDRDVQPGEYRFHDGTSWYGFLRRIASGKSQINSKVTILEGWTFRQMRDHLLLEEKLEHTTADMSDQQIMEKLGYPDLHSEGQFFPETYYYTNGSSDFSVYRQAFRLMQKKLTAIWKNRATDLILKNKQEVLILASIIEKETYVAEEKPRIAGVFHNRLRKGMRLQADPTVIYGLGDAYDGNIKRSHLNTYTVYNTYRRHGLPPTPISLPGESALKAAANPVDSSAYYFVASGNGRHYFSDTLVQHNRAVRKYLKSRKKQKPKK